MKITILGGRGQIGSLLLNHLRHQHDVVATSRTISAGYLQFDPFHDDWARLGNPEVVINCVGLIEPTRVMSFHRIHVELSQLLINHRAAMGNPRIIQISALGASASSTIEFLKTKGIADEFLCHHPNCIVVRPSIVCTHQTMIVRKLLLLSRIARYTLGVLFIPNGFLETRIQPIMPDDLSDLIDHLCVSDTEGIINAVGPERYSFRNILNQLREHVEQTIHVVELPRTSMSLFIKRILIPLFPRLVNDQQYELLFCDNIADAAPVEKILGRPLTVARQYFDRAFSTYAHP